MSTAVVQLQTKWQKKKLILQFTKDDTLDNVKEELYKLTNVLPKNQKLLGFPSGSTGTNILGEMSLKDPFHRFVFMGTPEDKRINYEELKSSLPLVVNDLEQSYTMHSVEWQHDVTNESRLQDILRHSNISLINGPRRNKKLVVLDLDHTILDFQKDHVMKRPHMDYFLAQVFTQYDIAIWSQTSWVWLEIKLTELGMLNNSNFHICFVLDKSTMFAYEQRKEKTKKKKKKYVKPLQVIWDQFHHWTAENTLHIDDLERNFMMNPKNGIKIKGFYRDQENARNDTELVKLADYLLSTCSSLRDVTTCDHQSWNLSDAAKK